MMRYILLAYLIIATAGIANANPLLRRPARDYTPGGGGGAEFGGVPTADLNLDEIYKITFDIDRDTYQIALDDDDWWLYVRGEGWFYALGDERVMSMTSSTRFIIGRLIGGSGFYMEDTAGSRVWYDAVDDEFYLGTSPVLHNNGVIITTRGNLSPDHDIPNTADPTLWVFSQTNPDTDNTQWINMYHDTADGVIDVGSGSIKFDHSIKLSYVAINNGDSPYTVTNEHHTIDCDATAGVVTVNLPAVSGLTGRIYRLVKNDASVNACTFDGDLAETINGAATASITTQYGAITVQCTGTEWRIISEK